MPSESCSDGRIDTVSQLVKGGRSDQQTFSGTEADQTVRAHDPVQLEVWVRALERSSERVPICPRHTAFVAHPEGRVPAQQRTQWETGRILARAIRGGTSGNRCSLSGYQDSSYASISGFAVMIRSVTSQTSGMNASVCVVRRWRSAKDVMPRSASNSLKTGRCSASSSGASS